MRSKREIVYGLVERAYIYIYIHMPSYYHAPASSSPFLTYLLLLKKKVFFNNIYSIYKESSKGAEMDLGGSWEVAERELGGGWA